MKLPNYEIKDKDRITGTVFAMIYQIDNGIYIRLIPHVMLHM